MVPCRRHAERIAQVWLQRMKESPPNKKLVLIYLANEITQTSKMRKKEEFLRAYEPILPEATAVAYRGSPVDIQNKIRRVVEVWRSRQIFSLSCQQEIEKGIDGMAGLVDVWESILTPHRTRSLEIDTQASPRWFSLLLISHTPRTCFCCASCHISSESRASNQTSRCNCEPGIRETHKPERCNTLSSYACSWSRSALPKTCCGRRRCC